MDDRDVVDARGRGEPRGLTLADLLMLVAGFAVVFALPRLHHMDDPYIQLGAVNIPMPEWESRFLILREVVSKCGLILVPAILARRARYGGLPHAAEWLAILVALPWAVEAVEASAAKQRLARWYLVDLQAMLGYPVDVRRDGMMLVGGVLLPDSINPRYAGFPIGFDPGDERPLTGAFTAIVLIGLLTALQFGRKRIPAWAGTILLAMAAVAGLEGARGYLLPLVQYQAWEAISRWFGPSSGIAHYVNGISYNTFHGFLLMVPTAALLFAFRAGPWGGWTWIGRAGAITALFALAADLGFTVSMLVDDFPPELSWWFTILVLPWIVAGLGGWGVVRWARRPIRLRRDR